MMDLQSIKEITVKRCLLADACSNRFVTLIEAKTHGDLIELVKNVFPFVEKHGIVKEDEWEIFFGSPLLELHHVYCTGTHSVLDGSKRYFVGNSIAILRNGSIGVMGNKSAAHVYDNSLAEIFENASGIKYSDSARVVKAKYR